MRRPAQAGAVVVLGVVLVTLFVAGRGRETAAAGEPGPTAVAPEAAPVVVAPAGRLGMTPVEPGSEAAARGLPMKSVPRPDLAFLAEAARLEKGTRPAAVDELVALAQTIADGDTLRAAADRLLADRLALRLAARRWIAAREGVVRGELIPPRPARVLVGGFEHR